MTVVGDPDTVRSAVLTWGVPRLRDLPWRTTRDPWAVLVSEVMLQQTGIHRVVPKWLAFLDAHPTPAACAEASLGDILRLWQGLGYPRRARNLHAAAQAIVEHHDGRVPDTLPELLALPGVGGYTARAVMAFAHELDVAVVDTNIARVLARSSGRRLTGTEVQALADALQAPGESWAWNQSIMDLGATVCRANSPVCPECPLQTMCTWRCNGWPDPDPSVGSAGVSGRQSRFDGSDRQARGRLLRALGPGPVRRSDAPHAMGLVGQDDRADRLVDALVAEGLVVDDDGVLRLP